MAGSRSKHTCAIKPCRKSKAACTKHYWSCSGAGTRVHPEQKVLKGTKCESNCKDTNDKSKRIYTCDRSTCLESRLSSFSLISRSRRRLTVFHDEEPQWLCWFFLLPFATNLNNAISQPPISQIVSSPSSPSIPFTALQSLYTVFDEAPYAPSRCEPTMHSRLFCWTRRNSDAICPELHHHDGFRKSIISSTLLRLGSISLKKLSINPPTDHP